MPVGDKLATERRKQGRTLMDVENSTHVFHRLLELLEEGRYSELPSPAYVRGYIQNYAHFLGMDPEPLLREYEADLGASSAATPRLTDVPERTVVAHRDQVHHVDPRTWLAIVAGLVVLALLIWAVTTLFGPDETPPPIPPTTSTSTAEPTGTPGVTTGTAQPDGTDAEPLTDAIPQPFELVVTVDAGQASWVRITVDGLVAYEGTLSGGQSETWTVAETATVRIGKPDAVTITRDGETVEVASAEGIGEVTLDAQPSTE